MTHARAAVVTVALVATLLALPGTALATHGPSYPDTPKGALKDCAQGHYPLKGHYTIKVLQQALKQLLADKLQYTNCAQVLTDTIHKLELTAQHSGTGGNSNPQRGTRSTHSGTGTGTPSIIKRHLSSLKKAGAAPVVLPSGQTVTPGTVTVHGASFLSNLPTPLLIVLAALLATVLGVGARSINNLVRARRTH